MVLIAVTSYVECVARVLAQGLCLRTKRKLLPILFFVCVFVWLFSSFSCLCAYFMLFLFFLPAHPLHFHILITIYYTPPPLTPYQIKTMGIHEAKHPEVQFVMAVRAFPLYNNILSLWVFLGTLEPIAGH